MKILNAVPFAALVLSAIIVSGCGGGGAYTAATNATPTPIPSPSGGPCTPPPGTQFSMVFPQSGPTGVPNNQGIVIAVAPAPLPTNWYVYVVSANNASPAPPISAGGFLQAAPSPLPTPNTLPAFANPSYQLSSNGLFATGTAFNAYLANTNCFPGISLGSFNT